MSEAAPEEARHEAARQLLSCYYQQVLGDGFFHADPHPGNLRWADGEIWFLDFGMVGELDPDIRLLLLLLVMAFWRDDAPFLAETLLMLSGPEVPAGPRHRAPSSEICRSCSATCAAGRWPRSSSGRS